ncbi:hypothetical protein ACRAWF_25840 [Streptomyces sp. L7]
MAELNIASRAETTILMDAAARVGSLLHDPSLEIELAKIVEQGRQRGELRTGVDAEQVGAMLAACYFSTILRWIRAEPAPFDLRDRLDGALDVILLGMLAREGKGRAFQPLSRAHRHRMMRRVETDLLPAGGRHTAVIRPGSGQVAPVGRAPSLPKPRVRVRFSSPAPLEAPGQWPGACLLVRSHRSPRHPLSPYPALPRSGATWAPLALLGRPVLLRLVVRPGSRHTRQHGTSAAKGARRGADGA